MTKSLQNGWIAVVMDRADADAVVNEVFDHLKLKAQQLDGLRASFHDWLADVARNRARGALRAREWPSRSPVSGSPHVRTYSSRREDAQ